MPISELHTAKALQKDISSMPEDQKNKSIADLLSSAVKVPATLLHAVISAVTMKESGSSDSTQQGQ